MRAKAPREQTEVTVLAEIAFFRSVHPKLLVHAKDAKYISKSNRHLLDVSDVTKKRNKRVHVVPQDPIPETHRPAIAFCSVSPSPFPSAANTQQGE